MRVTLPAPEREGGSGELERRAVRDEMAVGEPQRREAQ
jgi:hypothetical protein